MLPPTPETLSAEPALGWEGTDLQERGGRNSPRACLSFRIPGTSSPDCHNKSMLDCKFDEAVELLKGCGYKEKYVLTDCGFMAVSL